MLVVLHFFTVYICYWLLVLYLNVVVEFLNSLSRKLLLHFSNNF